MHKIASRWFALIAALAIMALTSGCFQQAGAVLEASPVAFDAQSAPVEPTLFEIVPSETPTPDLLPIDVATLEIIAVAQVPSETPTPDELATLNALSTELAATQTAFLFTATPNMLETLNAEATNIALTVTARAFLPTDTLMPTETPDFVGTQVADAALANPNAAQDDFSLTATALSILALGGNPADVQPFDTSGQVDDPGFQTATAVIATATAEAALFQTQTMEAIFGQQLTAAPTFDFFPFTQTAEAANAAAGAGGNQFATATSFVPAPSGTCEYIVQNGDNLFRISLRFNTTAYEIAAISSITNINLIVVGQRIYIPNCGGTTVPPYTVTFAPPPPGGCASYYRVNQNDTLFRISVTYSTTVAALSAANPQINNVNLIYIDQEICIP
ncbi:MAG: LysM peptidoglycan-binding domain-containing protein [Chloroflexota bacterium]|nr:LysM peptidoglycan-binding domain-containing protein [Chloroflexota bacterium]